MKKVSAVSAMVLCVIWFGGVTCFASDLKTTVKGITDILGGDQGKTEDPAGKTADAAPSEKKQEDLQTSGATDNISARGIKEALIVGVRKSVEKTGVRDGFFRNDRIKILLPEKIQKADKIIRQAGGGQLSEMLVEKMNRAAEKAVPEAEKIFIDAITSMNIGDASKIISGADDSATAYLKEKTSESLSSSFYPIIKTAMEEINAVKTFGDYTGAYASNPLLQAFDLKADISRHVTDKSVSGLFLMVAEEEKEIRKNPAARVTDLLKTVFGGK